MTASTLTRPFRSSTRSNDLSRVQYRQVSQTRAPSPCRQSRQTDEDRLFEARLQWFLALSSVS